jgi:phospholipid/cholesterol/gamma-HCH transport system ATP-binding protein
MEEVAKIKRFVAGLHRRERGGPLAQPEEATRWAPGSQRQVGPAIEIQHLGKSFGANVVLEDINLKIFPGEEVCFIGPTGCGKTLLTKTFNGLLTPSSGRVLAYGKDLAQASRHELEEIRRKIGYVFQGNALFASYLAVDVYDNVSLPLRESPYNYPAANEPQIEARVEEVLKEVGLGKEYFYRTANELSGGQKKRVALARAIAAKPEVVIYDEPTTGLDPQYTKIIIDLIEQLYKSSHNTTIAITHEKKLMKQLGRVVFVYDHKIYFDGKYEEFARSEDPIIKTFLARDDDPCNE